MVREWGWIQVLYSLIQFLEPSLRKRMQNYKYKIRYKSEYLFMAPPKALEGARVSEGPWSLNFIYFTVNPPLSRGSFIETNVFIKVYQSMQLIRWHYFYIWLKYSHVYFQGYCVGTSQISHSLERQFLGVFCQKILSEFLALFAICISFKFKLVCNSCVGITLFHLWQFLLIGIIYVIPPHNAFVYKTCYQTVLMYEEVLEIWDSLIYVVCPPGTEKVYFFTRAKQDPKERKVTTEISDRQDSWALLDCLAHLWVITNLFTSIAMLTFWHRSFTFKF
jgi:hypothetical protein